MLILVAVLADTGVSNPEGWLWNMSFKAQW